MYKIMLADDESIMIDALKFIIERNFPGVCQIESAKTGRSVIELAEKFRPDIAFMDIQMPGINGIEAMREIRKENKNIIFIVVSAYDRFDYAKEAVNLGVLEYVNKPIEQNVIVELLKKAMKKIDAEQERRSAELLIREKMESVVPIIESGLIYSILFQQNSTEEIDNFKQLLSIEEEYGYMMVVEGGETIEENHLTNMVGAGVRLQSSYGQLRDTIKEYFGGIIGSVMANMVIVLIPCQKEDAENEYMERIKRIETARKMIRKLNERIDAEFRVGIGSVKKIGEIADSYIEAMNSFRYISGSVAHVKDLQMECKYEEDYPIETEKSLFTAVERGDLSSAMSEANHFFDWMVEQYPGSITDIKLKVLEFVLWAEHIEYDSGGKTYHFLVRHEYLPNVMDFATLEEIRSWFVKKIQDSCRNIATRKKESSNSIVKQAKEYILQNYANDLSLDDVSREVNISPYYFSKLFKDEAKENFIEYVTGIRIEKAKELLEQSQLSVKEICTKVGYSDPNYFSRTFKKNVGVTPTEYKEK